MDVADESVTPPASAILQPNSAGTPTILTADTELHHSSSSTTTTTAGSSSFSSVDFELVSIEPTSYTSLRDILPSTGTAVQSPKTPSSAVQSSSEITIRNRLVQQAAWAYLQPMSTTSESDGSTAVLRLWTRISTAVLRLITQAFDCLLRSIQLRATYSRS